MRANAGTSAPNVSRSLRLLACVVCIALYAWLGSAVSFSPPAGLDAAAASLTGRGARAALPFTESLMLPALVLAGCGLLLFAWRFPAWRPRVFFSIVLTLLAWRISDFGKDLFHRPRPEHWVLLRESSFSYASGHAMDAVIVPWLWAGFVWKSELPRGARALLAALLIAWGFGAIWSRLALGAHYPSDLGGGILLGTGLLALGAACVPAVFERPVAAGAPVSLARRQAHS